MIRIIRITLFGWLLWGCSHQVSAQTAPVIDSVLRGSEGQLIVGAEAYVEDVAFYDPSWSVMIRHTNKLTNVISLRLNEYLTDNAPDSFGVTAALRIIYTDKNGAVDSVEKSLVIDYNKKRKYNSRAHFYFENAHKVKVKVLQLTAQHAVLANVDDMIELSNEMIIDRDFTLDCTEHAITTITINSEAAATTGELLVSWPAIPVAEEYDLEWTYVDSSALNNGRYHTGGQIDPRLLFRFNATRVSVVANSYRIPLLYDGGGVLYARVRAVQTIEGKEVLTTPWSSDYMTAGLGEYGFAGHERLLNWQASTSFAEEGKRKSVVQYFDGSLKGRQTVTKDNTTDTTIVAETLYDKQGRPVIQVLPAPSLSNMIGFTPRFNTINGMEYDKGIYDTVLTAADYCDNGAPAMDTTNGTSYYYSSNNHNAQNGIHQYIPNGYGFVFTETKYSLDNTGRIRSQSGVGPDFRIGSGKETKYYYGSPDQEELDALFGTEAGDATHYQKNMVRDANGQYSVSYVDMRGRTVATALAGNTPASLEALASYMYRNETTQLITPTNNLTKGMSLESVKGLVVTRPGLHAFNYQLNPESLELEDCNAASICYDCLYDLEITITDDCNNQTLPGDTAYKKIVRNFTLGSLDTTCTPAQAFNVSFDLELSEGSYTITKKLTISQEAMNWYRDSLFLRHNTCKSYEDVVNEQREVIQQQLGDCEAETVSVHDYESYREQMLRDMRAPSGQYANLEEVNNNYSSIFGTGLRYKTVSGYKDANGQPAVVYINGQARTPQSLTAQEFVDHFEESWAEALLPLHPEYRLLLEYEKLANSHIWTEDFEKTDTYAEALAKGYLNPTGNTTTQPASLFDDEGAADPIFTDLTLAYGGTVSSAGRTAIDNALFAYVQQEEHTLSAWGIATSIAKCTTATNETYDLTCMQTWNTPANVFGNALCEGELDMAWRIFRGIYLDIRSAWISDFIHQLSGNIIIAPPAVRVFHRAEEMINSEYQDYLTKTPAEIKEMGQQKLDDSIEASCLEYAQRWVQQLGTCNYSQSDLDIIIPRLVEVCKQGGDVNHPFGASTVNPESTYEYRSFDDVIRQFNLANSLPYDASCNGYLIDLPKAYDQPVAIVDKPLYGKPDDCDCEQINTRYSQYGVVSGQYASFSDYMQKRHATMISNGALDTLRGLCNGTIECQFIPQLIQLPPALQCGTGDVCVDCQQVTAIYDSFKVKFPTIIPLREEETEEQREKNTLFAKFMNHHFGFDKSAIDYLDFLEGCDTTYQADSLAQRVRDFRSYYKDVSTGQIYNKFKISPAAHALVDAANALIQARRTAANPVVPQGYAIIPRTSDYSSKLLGVARNSSNTSFQAIVPLALQNTYSHPELEANTVLATDFVTGAATVEQLSNKYYAVVMQDRSQDFRVLWSKEGTNAYSFYSLTRPLQKYLPDSATNSSDNHSYYLRFFELPLAFREPALYKEFIADSLSPAPDYNYTFRHDQIKAIRDLRFAPEVLPYTGVSETVFARSYFGLKVTLELQDGTVKDGWLHAGYAGTGYVIYKDLIDTSLYDTDCHKAFTYYFNQQSGTSYTEAQVDSIYLEQTGELPAVCVTNCNTLEDDLADYYKKYVRSDSGYVDLQMRTFAGNITPAQGPKGVFDINGDLVGNTVDGTEAAINESFASIWNSSTANATVGTLASLPGGFFRLYLNPGQQAPCDGIIGQRYYQFDVPVDTLDAVITGPGSYIDFGDGHKERIVKDLNARNTKVSYYEYLTTGARQYSPGDSSYHFFRSFHSYPDNTLKVVTVYHPEVHAAFGFDNTITQTPMDIAKVTHLRGYIPQFAHRIAFSSTRDSLLNTFDSIYNFNQVNTIKNFDIWNGSWPLSGTLPDNTNFSSLENNRSLSSLSSVPYDPSPAGQNDIQHLSAWLPDLPVKFPQLVSLRVTNYYGESANADFSLPNLRNFMTQGYFTSEQMDSIIIQVARSTRDSGSLAIYNYTTGIERTSASDAAVASLTARKWNLIARNLSVSNPAPANIVLPKRPDLIYTNQFTEFYNQRNGTSYSYAQLQHLYDSLCGKTLDLCSLTGDTVVVTNNLLCGKAEPYTKEIEVVQPDACSDSTQLITITATEIYRVYLDSLKGSFNDRYAQQCLAAGSIESFTVTRPVSEYHYTLYYYDQAGNLVKTIPPAGVQPNRDTEWLAQVKTKRDNNEEQVPNHHLPTVYRYNTLNQVVTQNSPDGGLSKFWYDRLGRLTVSQNAKQSIQGWYSYTRYDAIGRITEVGEKPHLTPMTQLISRNTATLESWLNTNYIDGGTDYRARQVVQTVYDITSPVITPGLELYPRFHQRSYTLRNRVSFTRYFDQLPVADGVPQYGQYASATHYSYDIHGNVDTLLQDYRLGLMAEHGSYSATANNRFKLMAYHYDLISGKVNQVHYQPDEVDAMYHRYEYDAENRITDVYTTDRKAFIGLGGLEEHEAFYQYYKHGPLARTILGQQQVQGIDYAYTLQGWLKGVNSTSLLPQYDMGNDNLEESPNGLVAKDVYGFQLNYYTGLNGDYTAINRDRNPFPRHAAFMPEGEDRPLYNGNISSMVVSIPRLGVPQLYNYRYDQLNRITRMDVYRGMKVTDNTWNDGMQTLTALADYRERVSYDANGNILSYTRNGTVKDGKPLQMDELTYGYNRDGDDNLVNNRLRHVKDAIDEANYKEDIDNQGDDNYGYDAIGNLVRDDQENITAIEWSVYGKILSITRTPTTEKPITKISYSYDAAGNRLSKTVEKQGSPDIETTWYVRDASGNVMALYTHKAPALNTAGLKLTEHHLYGSSRLGIWNKDLDMDNAPTGVDNEDLVGATTLHTFRRGQKFFELSNHLGNVLVTISDRKALQTWDDGTANGGCAPGTGVEELSVDTRGTATSFVGRTTVNVLAGFESGEEDNFEIYTDEELDACVPVDGGGSSEASVYTAEIVSANDYYPFGMLMPGRSYTGGGEYRYGFNGKENDNEVKGTGVLQDYGMRIYDTRLGKFLSVDPIASNYPMFTSYQYASNTPIQAVDLDGLEGIQYIKVQKVDGKTTFTRIIKMDVYVAVSRNKLSAHYYSKKASGDDEISKQVLGDLRKEFPNTKFKDNLGLDVVWEFNVFTFEVDENQSTTTKRNELANNPAFQVLGDKGSYEYRGIILQQQHLSDQKMPSEPTELPTTELGNIEKGFVVSVNDEFYDNRKQRSHTLGHEVTHFFLRLHPDRKVRDPENTGEGHARAGGGILNYGKAVFNFPGQIITSPGAKTTVTFEGIKPLSQANVNDILKSVPKTKIENAINKVLDWIKNK